MPAEHTCPKCGAALPADAPKGLCPRCLMAAALAPVLDGAGKPTVRLEAVADKVMPERIGRYKILQQLGEGGCGEVYMAEQTEPVRRRVALKVIKRGMDTKQVIARFEAERQALALMDHPNIAKVLDAGATETGRPYFVMELVKGIRITQFCDQQHLSTSERLGLFTQVCQAIQHAHQKGIIHRDVKPSNILVTLHDGVPVPKVIDFGIAKATEQPLTEKTVITELGQFMGTPAYMSPEQAELSGLDIDTRSDIYSLGVLLYELLTGRTPFEAKELLQAGLDEMRRRIREEEPMRPSTRLSTMADADLTAIAQQRQSEPTKLTRFVRGDLDWIVMKCLEKDRRRRYETANGLVMDIQRHLNNEPVVACPPSLLYRFRKTVRRNRLAVAAASSVAAALILGLGLSTWLWLKERTTSQKLRDQMDFFYNSQFWRTDSPKEYNQHKKILERTLAAHGSGRRRKWTAPVLKFSELSHDIVSTSAISIPGVVPPAESRQKGRSYSQLAADWLKWSLEMPMTNSYGAIHHPWKITTNFDVTASQSSDVWFLAAPFPPPGSTNVERSCQVPFGKSLFFPLFVVEVTDLEAPPFYGANGGDQANAVNYYVAHFTGLFCEVDGIPLSNIADFRVRSPCIAFTAPAPWIQGTVGGPGSVTGGGYFVLLSPLAPGRHTLRFGGTFAMKWPEDPTDMQGKIDMTYHINVTDQID